MTLIGEATAYDKKQQLEVKRPKSWLKSVSAFSNGEGGTLVFGISDDDQYWWESCWCEGCREVG